MLNIGSFKTKTCSGIGRRSFLQMSGAIPFGLGMSGLGAVTADEVDDVITLTASDGTSDVTKIVSISITGAASCAARMILKAQRKFATLVRPDAVGAALEAASVTEGSAVPLDFSLDAPCGRQARFVAVVASA